MTYLRTVTTPSTMLKNGDPAVKLEPGRIYAILRTTEKRDPLVSSWEKTSSGQGRRSYTITVTGVTFSKGSRRGGKAEKTS
jgi:DNA-binding PadR family transcriptional regulator